MIDHEFRIVTPVVKKIILKQSEKERVMKKKIPHFVFQKKYLEKYNQKYLKKAKLIKGIYFRGFPINNKKDYFDQENQLRENFHYIKENSRKNIFGKQLIQIPNPENVNFSDFTKNLKIIKNYSGFEIIPSWHGKNINDQKYERFLSFVQETGLPLSLEVDYFYRNSNDQLYYFFSIIKKFPNIKYWLPHLGCGIFLHWEKVNEVCKFKPCLLSSTNNLSDWYGIIQKKFLKKLPLKFASDHPFNGLASLKIYDTWLKNFKKS